MLWSKKFVSKKSWVRTIFVSKKTLGQKKFKVSKKDPKIISVQNLGSKKFMYKKMFPENF